MTCCPDVLHVLLFMLVKVNKLVYVKDICDITATPYVARELMLIKVTTPNKLQNSRRRQQQQQQGGGNSVPCCRCILPSMTHHNVCQMQCMPVVLCRLLASVCDEVDSATS